MSPLEFDELTEYYINLLILQYNNRPNARNTVGVFLKEEVADRIIQQVQDAFNVDTAVGDQLDLLAQYRGASRTVVGLDITRGYFAMPGYDDDTTGLFGFAEYDDATVTWFWLLYASANQPVYALTDDELRRLIKFLAKTQSRYLSNKELDDIFWEFFADKVNMIDNADMTVTYEHVVGDPDNLFTIVEGTGNLPQPAGVEVIVV